MEQEKFYLKEFEYYFNILNKEEKKAVYALIKTMASQAAFRDGLSFSEYSGGLHLAESEIGYSNKEVMNKEDYNRTNIQQYNKEIEEAMQSIDDGESYSHEEVVELSKQSLNGR